MPLRPRSETGGLISKVTPGVVVRQIGLHFPKVVAASFPDEGRLAEYRNLLSEQERGKLHPGVDLDILINQETAGDYAAVLRLLQDLERAHFRNPDDYTGLVTIQESIRIGLEHYSNRGDFSIPKMRDPQNPTQKKRVLQVALEILLRTPEIAGDQVGHPLEQDDELSKDSRHSPKSSEPNHCAYLTRLTINDFTCISSAELTFKYPGSSPSTTPTPLDNINLVLGDNGSGKTSILKAIAISCLGGVLSNNSGLYLSKAIAIDKDKADCQAALLIDGTEKEYNTAIRRLRKDEVLQPAPLGEEWLTKSFLLCAYGANSRRSKKSDDGSSFEGNQWYQRIAGLFSEEHVLESISRLFQRLSSDPKTRQASPLHDEAIAILDELLQDADLKYARWIVDGSMNFEVAGGGEVPFQNLSDGHRSFLAMIGDLMTHLCEVASTSIRDVSGIVLVDELDLHLHPSWQRVVLTRLSETFPKLQFIVSSHSPILVGCLPPDNVHICERNQDGQIIVAKLEQDYRGKMIDTILRGDTFGLPSTLSPEEEQKQQELAEKRAELGYKLLQENTTEAAAAYLEAL